MKGVETSMRKVLEGTKQFVIPAYQRAYAWQEAQWLGIWRPVLDQFTRRNSGQPPSPYFMGSLVIHGHNDGSSAMSRYDVIDGQQRLTTVIVMLAALRDCADNGNTAESIDEQILRNKFSENDGRLKLLPKAGDSHDLTEIILERKNGSGRINLAYQWFRQRINEALDETPGGDHSLLQAMLDGLLIVEITTAEGDNPHRIFQTLNSTGVSLSEVDKLRSHFFMLLPNSHEQAHAKYWIPIESDLPGQKLSRFLWVDLVSRGKGDEQTKASSVYDRWQQKLQLIEGNESQIIQTLADLKRRAMVFRRIATPQGVGALDARLGRLAEWGTNVHQPLTHHILELVDSSSLSEPEALECLDMIESFLVRRMLVGVPTNNLNRIFTTTVGQIASRTNNLPTSLHQILSERTKYWPTDLEVRTDGPSTHFAMQQQTAQRHFVLKRIEESLAIDGHTDWKSANFSLEHFMPQNLNEDWSAQLKSQGISDPHQEHAKNVHLIGNLTLTSLNQRLSDSPQKRKQEILTASKLQISTTLTHAPTWGPAAIQERSEALIELALGLWRGPIVESTIGAPSPDWTPVESALAGLEGSEWTTLAQLVELVDSSSEQPLISHLEEAAPKGHLRILTTEGLADVRFSWVRADVGGYRDTLVGIGVLASTSESVAEGASFVAATGLAERASAE